MTLWIDRLLALVALAALAIFLAVPVLKVAELDLTIVIVAVTLLAAVDFFLAVVRRRNGNGNN